MVTLDCSTLRRLLLVPLLAVGLAASLHAQPQDPVEALKKALYFNLADDRNPQALEYRRTDLQKKIDALTSLGQLRRALELTEWKDTIGDLKKTREIDQAMRNEVGKRFQAGVKQIVAKGSVNAKLAAATLIGEMGPQVRALSDTDEGGFTRSLTPEVLALVGDPSGPVREAALNALGKINPDVSSGLVPVREALQKDDLSVRRAAAAMLPNLVKTITDIRLLGGTQSRIEASPKNLNDTCMQTVLLAAASRDPDALVRQGCYESIHQASLALADSVPVPYEAKNFPPRGRPMSMEEEKLARAAWADIQERRAPYETLTQVLGKQGALLTGGMGDADPDVRTLARQCLEQIARARLRLKQLENSVPLPGQAPPAADPLWETLEAGLRFVVANHLTDPDPEVRRKGIYFLEMLEDKAAPAVPALTAVLRDQNTFVRWAAARALGKIGPANADVSVPILAKVLFDRDLDVRKVAARTLESYGRAAVPAIPALNQAMGHGDGVGREAAIYALRGIGGPEARSGIQALMAATTYVEPRVRRAALETLGSFGPDAIQAVEAVRNALFDQDDEVRRAAADALLQIQPE